MLKMRQSLLAVLLVILPVAGVHSPAAAVDSPKPTPKPRVEITPVAALGQKVDVDLDQPFVVRPGQSARIEAEDVSLPGKGCDAARLAGPASSAAQRANAA